MSDETIYLLIGFLGVLFHCLLKANSLAADFRTANLDFNPVKDYLLKDLFAILASFCSVLIWYFIFEEVATKYTSLQNFVRVSFFVMGAMGSYILQLLLSRAKKQIRQAVDIKTNIADGIVPPVNNTNKEGLEVIKPQDEPTANDITTG